MITQRSELFCMESKTQVYAVLHDLLSRNKNIFEALSKKHSLKLLYNISLCSENSINNNNNNNLHKAVK